MNVTRKICLVLEKINVSTYFNVCRYVVSQEKEVSSVEVESFMASPLQLAVGPRPSQGGLFTNF